MFPATVRRDVTALNGTAFQHVSGYRVHLQEVTQLDISATQIRALAGSGKSIRYLVPGPVETYILSKGLYSVGGSGEGHR